MSFTDREFHQGSDVHSNFDSGDPFALRHSRAEAALQQIRNKLTTNNVELRNDVEQLNKNGYVVLRGLIQDKQVLSDVLQESNKLLQATPFGRNQFEGRLTRRVHNLTSKSRAYDQLVLNRRCLNILDYFLYPNHLLSILQLIEVNPHSAAQPLHYDSQSLYGIPRPRVHNPMQLAFFWALDDNYTPENGATVIYPGSHLWPQDRYPTEQDKAVSFTLKPGDAICILGTVWHGAGKHSGDGSQRRRIILTSQHVQPYIRQVENLMLATPFDIIDSLPKRLQAMIGYSIHFPFYGSVDGVHPKKVLPGLLKRYRSKL